MDKPQIDLERLKQLKEDKSVETVTPAAKPNPYYDYERYRQLISIYDFDEWA